MQFIVIASTRTSLLCSHTSSKRQLRLKLVIQFSKHLHLYIYMYFRFFTVAIASFHCPSLPFLIPAADLVDNVMCYTYQ